MNRKKLNLILVGLFVVFVVLLAVNTKKYLHDYTVNTNILLAKIVCLIQERYPEVNKKDIIGLLNEKDFKNNLTEYKFFGSIFDSKNFIKMKNYIGDNENE